MSQAEQPPRIIPAAVSISEDLVIAIAAGGTALQAQLTPQGACELAYLLLGYGLEVARKSAAARTGAAAAIEVARGGAH